MSQFALINGPICGPSLTESKSVWPSRNPPPDTPAAKSSSGGARLTNATNRDDQSKATANGTLLTTPFVASSDDVEAQMSPHSCHNLQVQGDHLTRGSGLWNRTQNSCYCGLWGRGLLSFLGRILFLIILAMDATNSPHPVWIWGQCYCITLLSIQHSPASLNTSDVKLLSKSLLKVNSLF